MKDILQQLAEKLGGNYWEKGSLKRIYIDRGYNTKKMSTKTFIWQDENGDLKVSCRIECSSQPYEWIKSQEDEVKNSVYDEIDRAMATEVFVIVDESSKDASVNKHYPLFYSKDSAEKEIVGSGQFILTFERAWFESEVERLEELESAVIVKEHPAPFNPQPAAIKNSEKITYGVGTKIKHPRFATGTVTAEGEDKIEILFDDANIGSKKLLKKFISLEIIGG